MAKPPRSVRVLLSTLTIGLLLAFNGSSLGYPIIEHIGVWIVTASALPLCWIIWRIL